MEFDEIKTKGGTIDSFYGFWKYLGITGVFFVGLAFFWWGIIIVLSGQWVTVRTTAGPLGNIILMPLAVGLTMTWISFAEFLRIIRNGGN